MAENDFFAKLEARLKAVVDAIGLDSSVTVSAGSSAGTLEPPFVICAARETSGEVFLDSSIYEVTAAVVVGTNMDDETLATHRARVAEVFDAFRQSGIAATLSDETEGIYVYQVHSPSFESEQEERELMDVLTFTVVACPKHLAA